MTEPQRDGIRQTVVKLPSLTSFFMKRTNTNTNLCIRDYIPCSRPLTNFLHGYSPMLLHTKNLWPTTQKRELLFLLTLLAVFPQIDTQPLALCCLSTFYRLFLCVKGFTCFHRGWTCLLLCLRQALTSMDTSAATFSKSGGLRRGSTLEAALDCMSTQPVPPVAVLAASAAEVRKAGAKVVSLQDVKPSTSGSSSKTGGKRPLTDELPVASPEDQKRYKEFWGKFKPSPHTTFFRTSRDCLAQCQYKLWRWMRGRRNHQRLHHPCRKPHQPQHHHRKQRHQHRFQHPRPLKLQWKR